MCYYVFCEQKDAQSFVTNLMTEEEAIGATAVSEVSVFGKRDTMSTFPSPPVGGIRGGKMGSAHKRSSVSTAGETYDDSYTYGGEEEGKDSSPEAPGSEGGEEYGYGSSGEEGTKGSRRKSFLSEQYSDEEEEEEELSRGGRTATKGSSSRMSDSNRKPSAARSKRSR
jgi:hypothetical protein